MLRSLTTREKQPLFMEQRKYEFLAQKWQEKASTASVKEQLIRRVGKRTTALCSRDFRDFEARRHALRVVHQLQCPLRINRR